MTDQNAVPSAFDDASGLIPLAELEELAGLDDQAGGTGTPCISAATAIASAVTASWGSGVCPTAVCTHSCQR